MFLLVGVGLLGLTEEEANTGVGIFARGVAVLWFSRLNALSRETDQLPSRPRPPRHAFSVG